MMGIFSRTTSVYWVPVHAKKDDALNDLLWYKPEPVYYSLVHERNKETDFLQCPAVINFFKDTYIVRSPADITFKVNSNTVVVSKSQKGVIESILETSNTANSDVYASFQLTLPILFFSKESVEIQQLPAFMHTNRFTSNTKIIPGKFDISKWVRPIVVGFEVVDIEKDVVIKRGDPIYYVKLTSQNNKRIKLEQVEMDFKLAQLVSKCTGVKFKLPNNSLGNNYKLAESAINRFWNPKKCPWGG